MQTHLEAQQREDIRRDLAERMKFVPPDLRAGEHEFYWPEDLSKIHQGRKSGKWLKVEIIAVKGSMAVVNASKTPEGRSTTFGVQGLVLFPFFLFLFSFSFLFLFSGALKI